MLLVVPEKTAPGWSGEQEGSEAEAFPVLEDSAWTDTYDTDAYAVQYIVPGTEVCPRLNKPAAAVLEAKGAAPMVHWIIVDVDNPGHAEHPEDFDIAPLASRLEALPEFASAGFYLTRHGYRLVWKLDKPLHFSIAEDWKAQFQEYLAGFGIEADERTCDWNRLFRLPNTTTYTAAVSDFTDLLSGATLKWQPPRTPVKGQVSSAPSGSTAPAGNAPLPSLLPRVKAAEWDLLKDTPYFEPARAGLPLAQKGERNSETIRAIGTILARASEPDPLLAYRILLGSVQAQVEEGSRWDRQWLWEKCHWFASLERGRREHLEAQIAATKALAQTRRESAAETLGHPDEDAVVRHLVISAPPSYYVLDSETLTYLPAVQAPLILRDLRRHTKDMCPTTVNEQGHALGDRELLARYSTSPREIVLRYGLTENRYDPSSGVLYERAGSVRPDLEPREHPRIQRWLELLGGEHADSLLDWLATLTQVQQPTAALYLRGENSVGKGLLGHGLARIWGAHCNFEDITKEFNQRLVDTPLVWADEKAEVDRFKSASAAVRRLVGASEFQIRRLYRAPATLQGCPRLLITANNATALAFDEALSGDDVGALVRRFGYIYAGNAPKEYLESIGGREATEAWVAGDGIAEHVLWLSENRTVTPGARYLVEGWAPEYAEDLVTHQSLQGQACIALVRYLLGDKVHPQIVCQNGDLWVNGSALEAMWKQLLGKDTRVPNQNQLSEALGSMSYEKDRVSIRGNRFRAWRIKLGLLTRAAEELNLADEEDITAAVRGRSIDDGEQ